MIRITVSLAVALALLTVSAQAEPCKTQGHSDAKELTFDLKSDETLRGLRLSFGFGLMPAEFPTREIAAIADPCSRGKFAFKAGLLELFGEDEDSPPRWAKASAPQSPVAYLAVMPKPAAAAAWSDKRSSQAENVSFGPDDMMFVVVFSGVAETRLVFHFFDRIPDDERLKSIMGKIASGEARWQVGFDVKTTGVTLNTQ